MLQFRRFRDLSLLVKVCRLNVSKKPEADQRQKYHLKLKSGTTAAYFKVCNCPLYCKGKLSSGLQARGSVDISPCNSGYIEYILKYILSTYKAHLYKTEFTLKKVNNFIKINLVFCKEKHPNHNIYQWFPIPQLPHRYVFQNALFYFILISSWRTGRVGYKL